MIKRIALVALFLLGACSMAEPRQLTAQATTTYRVASGTDDAEQRTNGSMYLNSSDLEFSHDVDTGQQYIGLRFPNFGVPKGATITSARLEVTADESSSGSMTLRIRAQRSSNALPFTTASYNISARPRTSAIQSWSPGGWTAGRTYGTSGLHNELQEVVNLPGYEQGNAVALIVLPRTTPRRVAESFESGSGPRLIVTWEGGTPAEPEPEPVAERTLIFSDEFNGTTLNTQVWAYCYGWTNPDGCHNRSNSSSAVYLPRNVEVSNGTLKLHGKKERVTIGGTTWEYTSGMVSSHSDYRDEPGFLHNKGYMEFRAKIPGFEGSWPAIWNHAAGGKWPPEIDVMESINNECDMEMHYHYLEGGTGSKREFGGQTNDVNICDTWHTYAVEWTSTSVTWYLDGVQRAKFTPSNPASIANEPMYLIMNLGVGGGWPGDMTGQALNETMEIDWVRVYR